MNGFGVTRVHYHDPQQRDFIETVKIIEFEERNGRLDLKKEREWSRKALLNEVKFNHDVFVLFDLDDLGPHLEMVEVQGRLYLRTDRRMYPHDFVAGLPEF